MNKIVKMISLLLFLTVLFLNAYVVDSFAKVYSKNSITYEWQFVNSEGNYVYEIISEKYARLIRYLGDYQKSVDVNSTYRIPEYVDGYQVKILGECLFSDTDVPAKNIVIPSSVTKIEKDVFRYADSETILDSYDTSADTEVDIYPSKLETVVIPESVVYIGDRAFKDCTKLKEITLPNNLVYLGRQAFYNCESLKTVTIPASINVINSQTFKACKNLSTINISSGINEIEQEAFMGCKTLKRVDLPVSVSFIKKKAFFNCPNLRYVQHYDHSTYSYDDKTFGYYKSNTSKKVKKSENLVINSILSVRNYLSYNDAVIYSEMNGFKSVVTLGKRSVKKYIDDGAGNVYNLEHYGIKAINWKSSDPKVASVTSKGKLTTLTKGTTALTAKLEDGSIYSVNIKVNEDPCIKYKGANDIYYKKVKKITVKKGKVKTLSIINKAKNVDNVYKGTPKAKITGSVRGNTFKVIGLKKGKTTLKVTVNGQLLKLKVTVK